VSRLDLAAATQQQGPLSRPVLLARPVAAGAAAAAAPAASAAGSSGVTDIQTDKQNGTTIRLTLCERDATGRLTYRRGDRFVRSIY